MSHLRVVSILLVLAVSAALVTEASARNERGPFRARVVDMETEEPIAGAVMLVVWWRTCAIFGQQCFVDAREGVTGADGYFEVPRLTGFHLVVERPSMHLFVPGYVVESLSVTPETGEHYVDPTMFRMRKLKTREEIRRKAIYAPVMVPPERMPRFLEAVEVEQRMLGIHRSSGEGSPK
jgi:hypothetical protein